MPEFSNKEDIYRYNFPMDIKVATKSNTTCNIEVKVTRPGELEIIQTCDAIKEFMLTKNTNYGNSALEPLRTFSKASSEEQLLIRMDDKLSWIKNSTEPKMNDIVDLTGYLLLYIAKKEWTSQIKEMID